MSYKSLLKEVEEKLRDIFSVNKRSIPRLQQTTFINIFHCFSDKIRLDVSSESSARQRIHM